MSLDLNHCNLDREGVGRGMYSFATQLFPVCRSLTGPGVRATLQSIRQHIPLEVHEVPTGTRVFDWEVPREWQIRDAYVKDAEGRRVIDFQESNLHVVGYSIPIHASLPWHSLREHLHTLPEHPSWIPYRTSYYEDVWGFCLVHERFVELDQPGWQNREYEVCIDATLAAGSLTYGELSISGRTSDEVLVACHICHPSLANDNLSGIAVMTWLAKHIAESPRRYSYRFLFLPGTIGPIVWLARHELELARIKHGLVVALAGDPGPSTYKRSRRGNAEIDRAAAHVLKHAGDAHAIVDFEPYGYHERQFCSPGFDLPVGCLTRTPYGRYPEYHTSADNLQFIRPECLADTWAKCVAIFDVLEGNRAYRNLSPKCEPHLGRRGLYRSFGHGASSDTAARAMLWVLNLADGAHSLLDIAERAGTPFATVQRAALPLLEHGLLAECETPSADSQQRVCVDPRGSAAAPTLARIDGDPQISAASESLRRRAHARIPGGAHTYSKGDDQYPISAPPFLVRGAGCHVWDADGHEFIEYGAGLRSVTLGHAFAPVVQAAQRQMLLGENFVRPSTLELQCAEALADCVPAAEMVKFAKNGSDVTTAAVKLARAYTGRDLVAICADHPFFSTDDWFIGTTAMDAGIPEAIRNLTVTFRFNNLNSVRELFARHPHRVACLVMEAATAEEPAEGFLAETKRLCQEHGALFIFDEIITGFRWHLGGAQAVYGVTPDLATFGKALANGFSLAALVGRREVMQLGGLDHDAPRVFLLSTTNGAENHCLAAAIETMRTYREHDVVRTLYRQGERLREGVRSLARAMGLEDYFQVIGRPCNLLYVTRDAQGERSQGYRTLFMQEIIRRGVIAPSFVVNYAHSDADIDRTLEAVAQALEVYARALDKGLEQYLQGRPVKPVFRRYN